MTTYIPSLTLPSQIFTYPATAILLPVILGDSIGFAVAPKTTQNTYTNLKRPPFSPPPAAFGPVWTVLYGMMGYASYRAWNIGHASLNPDIVALTKQGATLYTLQLALNLIWMPLFFRLERPIEATADIAILTATTSYLTYIWSQVDSVAAWCLVPYIGWLSFATYLSAGIGHLNGWSFANGKVPNPPKQD